MDVIKSAPSVAARLLRMEGQVGRIAPGAFPGTNESELHGSPVNPVAAAAGHCKRCAVALAHIGPR